MLPLRDDQWDRIREHFTVEQIAESRPGRKPVPARAMLEAVLWILNTGAQWHLLPQCYPNYKTVHRRFRQWCERVVLREILTQLANTLREEGALDDGRASLTRRVPRPRAAARAWAPPAGAKA